MEKYEFCIEFAIFKKKIVLSICFFSGINGVKISRDTSFYYLNSRHCGCIFLLLFFLLHGIRWFTVRKHRSQIVNFFLKIVFGHEHTFTGKTLQPPRLLALTSIWRPNAFVDLC